MKIRIGSGAEWEDIVGYSRAIKIGNLIEVAGTTAVKDGKVMNIGDAYGQTIAIFQIIEHAITQLGATMEDVIRTRIFVTDISNWEAVGKAHGTYFKTIKPVSTMVEVSGLIHPDMLVEIEVTAIIS
ncbi:MAG: RidA family protein [Saprospiraceae bacterium]|nr:RidA family protein [Saprospiraceae bacterium]